jgi:hypothetical protein
MNKMNESNVHNTEQNSKIYEIRVAGHLGRQWGDWFDGMAIRLEENGDTIISGPVTDQAALYGFLKKVRDLGLTLISVNPILIENILEETK